MSRSSIACRNHSLPQRQSLGDVLMDTQQDDVLKWRQDGSPEGEVKSFGVCVCVCVSLCV